MTLTYTQATDELNAIIASANESNKAKAALAYKPAIYWQGQLYSTQIDKTKLYLKPSRQDVLSLQKGLATEAVEGQRTRQENNGLLFVQLFAPDTDPKAFRQLELVAENLANALRKHKGNVIIRNAKVNSLPPENSQYRLNVVAEYQYDELA